MKWNSLFVIIGLKMCIDQWPIAVKRRKGSCEIRISIGEFVFLKNWKITVLLCDDDNNVGLNCAAYRTYRINDLREFFSFFFLFFSCTLKQEIQLPAYTVKNLFFSLFFFLFYYCSFLRHVILSHCTLYKYSYTTHLFSSYFIFLNFFLFIVVRLFIPVIWSSVNNAKLYTLRDFRARFNLHTVYRYIQVHIQSQS